MTARDPSGPGDGAPLGLLLANLGSPDAPTPSAVRRYLREFLSDPLVVDLPRLPWQLLLRLVILPIRSPRSARLYRSVWMEEGSPLIVHSRRQRERLQAALGPGWHVALGMRYGEPSLASAVAELEAVGCRRVVLLPMFPQASQTTTGTLERELARVIAARGPELELDVVPPYPTDAGYVAAQAAVIEEARAGRDVGHVVFSLHGLPVRYVEAGDPYRDHCEATAQALAAALGLADGGWTLAYQSRFGREPWLEPNTADVVPALAREHGSVLVACPGFTADCLETLEEIAIQLPEAVREQGGGEVLVAPCLNEHPRWIEALADLARRSMGAAGGSAES